MWGGGNGGESFRREEHWQAGPPLLFTLSLFSPLIHSFRSFVCLTNHYNHTQLNGEECELSKELSWPSTCVVRPRSPGTVRFCAPGALEARHLADNEPHVPRRMLAAPSQ